MSHTHHTPLFPPLLGPTEEGTHLCRVFGAVEEGKERVFHFSADPQHLGHSTLMFSQD